MKKYLFILSLSILFTLPAIATKLQTEKFLGNFEGSYSSFFSDINFSVQLKPDNELEFNHPKYGKCSTENTSSRVPYKYTLTISDEPLVLRGHEKVVELYSTIFCEKAWYTLIIETELNPDLSGRDIEAALLIRDYKPSTLLDKKIKLKKVN